MNAFDNLETSEQIRRIRIALSWIETPELLFGDNAKEAKARYRKLARRIHPDVAKVEEAEFASTVLNVLWEAATERIEDKSYGLPILTIGDYECQTLLGVGDIADIYQGNDDIVKGYSIKIVRDSADNYLMDNEQYTLDKLVNNDTPESMKRYYPEVVNVLDDGKGAVVEVLRYQDIQPYELVSLKQLGDYYDNRMPVRHIGWIWRRLIAALGYAHRQGVIHAAVTPDNILIEPVNHGLVLIDWIYASQNQAPIVAISTDWRDSYPPEVLDKHTPLPAVDTYMGAKSMLWACNDMPDALQAYFVNWCTTESELVRPDDFKTLLAEFDRTIYDKLGWQREFVPMDDLLKWEWFW